MWQRPEVYVLFDSGVGAGKGPYIAVHEGFTGVSLCLVSLWPVPEASFDNLNMKVSKPMTISSRTREPPPPPQILQLCALD